MISDPNYNFMLVSQKKEEMLSACKATSLTQLKAKMLAYSYYDRRLILYKPEDLIVPQVKTAEYYRKREKGMDEEFAP